MRWGHTHGWLLALLLAASTPVHASDLPDLGPAAPFRLTTQDGDQLTLADLKGMVVLVAFAYTHCQDVCLTETAKMVQMQHELGPDIGKRVYFVTITLDADHDKPAALRAYAKRFGVRQAGWSFLTGAKDEIRQVAGHYGVVFRRGASGIDHNTLTTLIDARGNRRVQYIGAGFDVQEMLADLRGLMQEGSSD